MRKSVNFSCKHFLNEFICILMAGCESYRGIDSLSVFKIYGNEKYGIKLLWASGAQLLLKVECLFYLVRWCSNTV